MSDPISPKHYEITLPDGYILEVRYLLQSLTERSIKHDTFSRWQEHCRLTALAYLLRADKKGGLEDIQKARRYLTFLLEDSNEIPF